MTANQIRLLECLTRLAEAKTMLVMTRTVFSEVDPSKVDLEEHERLLALQRRVETEQLHFEHMLEEEMKR